MRNIMKNIMKNITRRSLYNLQKTLQNLLLLCLSLTMKMIGVRWRSEMKVMRVKMVNGKLIGMDLNMLKERDLQLLLNMNIIGMLIHKVTKLELRDLVLMKMIMNSIGMVLDI